MEYIKNVGSMTSCEWGPQEVKNCLNLKQQTAKKYIDQFFRQTSLQNLENCMSLAQDGCGFHLFSKVFFF